MHAQITPVLGLWTQGKGPLYRLLAQALRQAIHATDIPANTRFRCLSRLEHSKPSSSLPPVFSNEVIR